MAYATGERVLMSEERLAEIEAEHIEPNGDPCKMGCWPCDALRLVNEVRELRRLLEML